MSENPTQLIARLGWGERPPSRDEAAAAEISHWLLPARIKPSGQLELAMDPDQLPSEQFSLEWWIEERLSPAAERNAAALFQPWLLHPRALQIDGRSLLWIHDPELLCHPSFTQQRFAPALLLVAGPLEPGGFEAIYERSDRLPCLKLESGLLHYESYLFHAHHRPMGEASVVIPCVTAQPDVPMECCSATNYREWLALSSAWSELRHANTAHRLVLVEHWVGHQRWHQPQPLVQTTATPHDQIPACEEVSWGTFEAQRPALLVHGFYLDHLAEMLRPIAPPSKGPLSLTLYVSTPLAQLENAEALLRRQGWDQVCLVGTPNRGRDMAPFLLELLPRALQAGHPWLVKLHTKRSLQTPGGEAWGQQLIEQLASPASLMHLQTHFSDPEASAVLAGEGSLLATTVCLSRNSTAVAELLRRLKIDPRWWLEQRFVAGSMWAARTAALEPLTCLVKGWAEFEPETGQIDGTMAHALERMTPAAIATAGVSTLPSKPSREPWDSPFGHPWGNPKTPPDSS